ncbi:kinetochore protein NDC80 homolog [Liolophura sinensis]|uniref:kinetochore protein NDC80 homolog n=1 Tax=Liolophura sinensis TaxID=3198878 RepID=UPI0031582D40
MGLTSWGFEPTISGFGVTRLKGNSLQLKMSKVNALQRHSKGRNSLSAEPLRIRHHDENNPRLSTANRFSVGRLSAGTSGQRKSFLPKSTSTGATIGTMQKSRSVSHIDDFSGAFLALLGVSVAQPSSGYGRGYPRSDVLKDPRPISDKSYMHRCIKAVVEFLLDNGYPHPISTKVLQSPQSRDFFRIFEYLFSMLYDPKYKLGKKPEEEIPSLMKLILYKFNISKSSLFTIGTAHTWPHLLAALTWLIVTQKICLRAAEDIEALMFPPDEDHFDSLPLARIQLNYCERTYESFLCGKDTYEDEDEELVSILRQNLLCSGGDLETLEADNRRYSQELELLLQTPDKAAELQGISEGLLTDEQTYGKYLQELEAHKEDQDKLLTEAEEEQLTLMAELKALQDNRSQMQKIFDTQEFSPADVDRIKQEYQEIQRQISSEERMMEKLDSDVWALEMGISKSRGTGRSTSKTDQKCHEYNKLAQRLKLIPSNAEYARGKDLEMRASFRGESSSSNFDTSIKPVIQELKMEFKERANAKAQMRITAIDGFGTELKCQKQEDVAMKESKLKRIEEDLNCKREMFQRELSCILKDTEETQEEVVQHRRRRDQTSVEEASKQLTQAQKRLEQKRTQMEKDEDEYARFLVEYTQTVLEHKQTITDGIHKMYGEMRQSLEQVEQSPYTPLFP